MALSRLEKLRNRRVDPRIKTAALNEAYERLGGEEPALKYAIGAMQPIDPTYTANTIEERDRVEAQLAAGYNKLGLDVEFDYQGSVTNDTHIRAHSDVDLLTLEMTSHSVELPNTPTSPYQGDPVADLRAIRRGAVTILKTSYPSAEIDDRGSKAINISGGSLRRKVDVIASNWWHTTEYVRDGQKHWKGIKILDIEKGIRVANRPFLHNKRLDDKDRLTNGGLRKIARLLKSVKYDSDTGVSITSYDIASVAYNIFDDWLTFRSGQDLLLIQNCQAYLRFLIGDKAYREQLDVPNGMRKVFCAEGATETGLKELSSELDGLVAEIEQGLTRSFRKLAEARIIY